MTITVRHDGKNLDVEVLVDVDGLISFAVWDGDNRLSYEMPPLTPFEAGMLAREMNRAADMLTDGSARYGFKHVVTLPPELGAVTKLDVRDGKVVAQTESGTPMIVPVPRD